MADSTQIQALQAQLSAWQRTLHGLALTLAQARASQNATMEQQVRSATIVVLRQIADLQDTIRGQQMPSDFMLALADVGDQAVQLAKDVGGIGKKLTDKVGSALDWIPVLLAGVVIVLGIGLYKGSLRAEVRR